MVLTMKNKKMNELKEKAYQIRQNLIELASKESIHIGGDLSSCDIMTVLWQYKIRYDINNPKYENRDRFVLSKGHASALLNLEQAMLGCYSKEEVYDNYAKDESMFAMHACNLKNPYIEVSTGSLGHGLAVACGIAAGLRLKNNNDSYVYVLMGDGEQSEGSVWEAAMNAVKYKLGNLVVFIDNNDLEADGFVSDITSLNNIGDKYKTFGWNVIDIDGNDIEQLVNVVDNLPKADSLVPTVIIAHTVKGYGISFMENNVRWHAGKLNEEDKKIALSSIENKRLENE